jgi:hypothetical protein
MARVQSRAPGSDTYYALDSPNLSKPCVPCTFEFLISVIPPQGYPSLGVAVKHRQIVSMRGPSMVTIVMTNLMT